MGRCTGLCANPNGPWNQFHRRDLVTRAGGWDSPPRQPPAHMTTLPWPRFVSGAFFRTRVGDRADSNMFKWQALPSSCLGNPLVAVTGITTPPVSPPPPAFFVASSQDNLATARPT